MSHISYDTFISILLGAILLEVAGLLMFLIVKKELPKKERYKIIYFGIIIYGLIAAIDGIIYKIDDFFRLLNIFRLSFYELQTITSGKWYYIFVPMFNEARNNTFAIEKSLFVFWIVTSIVSLIICVIMYINFDAFKHTIIVGVYIVLVGEYFPVLEFYCLSVLYNFFNKQLMQVWIAIVVLIIIALFIIFGAIIISKSEHK